MISFFTFSSETKKQKVSPENDLVHLFVAPGIETFVAEQDHKNKNKVELEAAVGTCGESSSLVVQV